MASAPLEPGEQLAHGRGSAFGIQWKANYSETKRLQTHSTKLVKNAINSGHETETKLAAGKYPEKKTSPSETHYTKRKQK